MKVICAACPCPSKDISSSPSSVRAWKVVTAMYRNENNLKQFTLSHSWRRLNDASIMKQKVSGKKKGKDLTSLHW